MIRRAARCSTGMCLVTNIVFINGLLKEVEQALLGVVELEACYLQMWVFAEEELINVAHTYCCKLRASVRGSAVVVFVSELAEECWKWGG